MRSRRGCLVAAVITTLIGSGSLVGGGSVAAATGLQLNQVVLNAYGLSVTSSTGRHLQVSVEADYFRSKGSSDNTDVYVGVSPAAGPSEFHSWQITVPDSDFHYDESTGQGSLDVGKAYGPLGSISLTFNRSGAVHNRSCDPSESSSRAKVSVSGSLTFDTRSKGARAWGSFSIPPTAPVPFHAAEVDSDYGHVAKACWAQDPCQRKRIWSGPGSIHGLLSGESYAWHGRRLNYVDFTTGHTILPPAAPYVNRQDDSFRQVGHPMWRRLRDGGIRLIIHPRQRAGVDGSATLTASGPPRKRQLTCGADHTLTEWYWQGASYRNGATQLEVKNQVFENGTSRNSAHGGYIAFIGTAPPRRIAR